MKGVGDITRCGAVLLLLLSVTGCRSKEERAVRGFCKAFEDCQPENFDDTFDSVEDCEDETERVLEEAEENNGPDCKEAFSLAIQCAADVNADTCDFDAIVDECNDEILDALDECPELDLDALELAGL